MAKMPFIPDPRYSNSNDRQYKAHQQIKEDVSMTQRAPYPQDINLPRHKMNTIPSVKN
jgi:DNA polymerase-3 subunit alpha/error-prone DNA polymerase